MPGFKEPISGVDPTSDQHEAMKRDLSNTKKELLSQRGRVLFTAAAQELEQPKYSVLGCKPVNDVIDFLRENFQSAPDELSGLAVDLKNALDERMKKDRSQQVVAARLKQNIDDAIGFKMAA